MQANRERNSSWVRCPFCGHKLFRTISDKPLVIAVRSESFVEGIPKIETGSILETKCHSCKEIVEVHMAEYRHSET